MALLASAGLPVSTARSALLGMLPTFPKGTDEQPAEREVASTSVRAAKQALLSAATGATALVGGALVRWLLGKPTELDAFAADLVFRLGGVQNDSMAPSLGAFWMLVTYSFAGVGLGWLCGTALARLPFQPWLSMLATLFICLAMQMLFGVRIAV